MKTALALLILVVLLGGGYYWYTQSDMTNDMDMNMDSDTNTNVVPNTNTNPITSTSTNTSTNTPSTGTTKEFTVTGKNFSFAPATMSVKKGDTVKITFVNDSGTHDLVVDGYNARTKVIQGGAQETITFVADKEGSFEYYCSVGQHRQMGMKGTLTVTP